MKKDQLNALLDRFLKQETSDQEGKMVDLYMLMAESEKADFTRQDLEETKGRIWTRIDRKSGKRVFLHVTKSRWIRVAAIWAVLVGITVPAFLLRYEILDQLSPIPWKTATAGPYEIKEVVLPDGSIVNLAQNSAIRFPSRYRGHTRKASLSGIAFFKISRNEAQPFEVASGELNIKVLGTSFEVRNAPDEPEMAVTVATGKVQVSRNDQSLAILTPNQQLRVNNRSGQFTVARDVDAATQTAWTENVLVFEETALEKVLTVLQAHYKMKISIIPNSIRKGATFKGAFNGQESGKEVLDIVCFSAGLQYTFTSDSTVVIKK